MPFGLHGEAARRSKRPEAGICDLIVQYLPAEEYTRYMELHRVPLLVPGYQNQKTGKV